MSVSCALLVVWYQHLSEGPPGVGLASPGGFLFVHIRQRLVGSSSLGRLPACPGASGSKALIIVLIAKRTCPAKDLSSRAARFDQCFVV